ncbi:proline-rich receptor-like protein kinase PERK2 [Telopea speciosissima]|uniref:proline-rich receptor-like protein kinase PERK2 n=1 Tax=Telopea speciosissima TaxID=54955 RepID=UPI001CC6E998|nr:proline-rich receptor-like protein kinase PERK2 [Telopea speciosissima]
MFKELQEQQRNLASHKSKTPKSKRFQPSSPPVVPLPPSYLPPSFTPTSQPTFQPIPGHTPPVPPSLVPWVPPPPPKPLTPRTAYALLPSLQNLNTLSSYLTQLTVQDPIPVLTLTKDTSSDTSSFCESYNEPPPPVFQTRPEASGPSPTPRANTGVTEPIVTSDSDHGSVHADERQQPPPPPRAPTHPFANQDPKQLFTFDGIPFHKWPEKISEFHAWLMAELL